MTREWLKEEFPLILKSLKTAKEKRALRKAEAGLLDFYKFYKEKAISDGVKPLSKKEYSRYFREYSKFFIRKVAEGEYMQFPARIGALYVRGMKRPLKYNSEGVPNLPPNWKVTYEYWNKNPEAKEKRKIIYHLNENTEGIVYKITWSKRKAFFSRKELYSLLVSRLVKKLIHEEIVKGKEYIIKEQPQKQLKK